MVKISAFGARGPQSDNSNFFVFSSFHDFKQLFSIFHVSTQLVWIKLRKEEKKVPTGGLLSCHLASAGRAALAGRLAGIG